MFSSLAYLAAVLLAPSADALPVTGQADANLAAFDQLMEHFIAEQKVPGAALAITYRGRLVYARGFGYADVERKTPVKPESLFRLASVSKPITATAVLQLVQAGKLKFDQRVVPLLGLKPHLEAGQTLDPRWQKVTIAQLLQQTAGFDRDQSFDPMFRPLQIARSMRITSPPGPEVIVRYMLGRPLDFTPGERYAYSNFGYCILGRVIEKVSGQHYDEYVKEHICKPIHVGDARIGRSLRSQQAPGEVVYYDHKHERREAVVGPASRVPLPYGTWYVEALDAHGGWIASAVDMARFAAAFDDPTHSPLLRRQSIAQMFTRPEGPAGRNSKGGLADTFYGCGWMVRPLSGGGMNTWHAGLLEGSSTLLVRRADGINWALLINSDFNAQGKELASLLEGPLHRAADGIGRWPKRDLFDEK